MWSLIHSALKSEYFKAAVSKCVKLQRVRVGIERADVSHNSSPCLGDSASVLFQRWFPSAGCPADLLEELPASPAPGGPCKYLLVHGSWNRHISPGWASRYPDLKQPEISAEGVLTVAWWQEFHSCHIPGLILVIISSFFLVLHWIIFLCCAFSRLCFVLLPGSMWNNCFLLYNKITA